ncbi:MAG: dihydroorotase [Oceanospirillaceae bacterium]|jgi:dihydroorotase|uniref:dihydroorotase n=1 Tax=Thalassolituus sp. TaxID=2030822 RepID=UPI000C476FCF|nr:dihydroorotase [Thalassolituus sp.]MAE34718.1 dihydroorotase [Oceanospirillaceae bacterium]MAE35764.1 dihydroorotase [Oceanospirillaceae bacterium]MDQ4423273.1 dihydroorotase [Thalassolituus sp.]MDQ4427379.1 dihydroorotase [Thalassolituus sp.]|tara:strand:- start:8183 stop:9220 length:1038 start_codon:yes stop_codon:yes gene_type:complete
MTDRLTITRPDDWHLHLRDGPVLQYTVPATARVMKRAIIMPNLQPPVMNAEQAHDYRQRIMSKVPQGLNFDPLMVLYLTDNTTPEMIQEAAEAGHIVAVKLYPAGATTNSASGVTDLGKLDELADALTEHDIKLLVHGEVTHSDVDIFDREKRFLDEILSPLVSRNPDLNMVVEHITTKDAAEFVKSQGDNVAATITVQHLAYNRNHMLVGGIKPHYYCLPILKRNIHQQALQEAVVSGSSKFFLGTDSAPHAKGAKESACGCAGCYTAYAAIELYAEIFDDLGALDKLEGFASHFGPDFYGLPRNSDEITLIKKDWQAPHELPFGDDVIVPLRAGETLRWKLDY